jgi:uncharacterized flavoprotein (TIGR03862 family)
VNHAAGRPSRLASLPRLAVVGGGPAGLMAADAALGRGVAVDLYDAKGSVGRKFLIAGRGGLNLTHSEPRPAFDARYGARRAGVGAWLDVLDPAALRRWASGMGIDTFTGSSGRVFPTDMKAAPLLRAWLRRLREAGLQVHVKHRCIAWRAGPVQQLGFDTPGGPRTVEADAVVFALGGASWPQLGSDGAWTAWLGMDADIAPLEPSNCGFDVAWSDHFSARFAGHPVKHAWLRIDDGSGLPAVQGEFVVSATGVQGSLVYALSSRLRAAIARDGRARLLLDLAPGRSQQALEDALSRPRKGRSFSEVLRRAIGLDGVHAGLVHECIARDTMTDPAALAHAIKSLPIELLRPRPIAEAISSAGGLRLECLDAGLMAHARPGAFFAGEMLDWDAPTGGYLLSACFASGRVTGQAAADWLLRTRDAHAATGLARAD